MSFNTSDLLTLLTLYHKYATTRVHKQVNSKNYTSSKGDEGILSYSFLQNTH